MLDTRGIVIRLPTNIAGCVAETTPNAEALAVFCHGFNGQVDPEKYWGHLPSLLRTDRLLSDVDLLYFSYESNASLYPNIKSFFGVKFDIPSIDSVFHSLADLIRHKNSLNRYKKIFLIGHSLGAHLAIMAAAHAKRHYLFHPDGVLLISPPTKPPIQARIHNALSFGRHAQIRFLADNKQLTETIVNDATFVRQTRHGAKSSSQICLIRSRCDSIAMYDQQQIFDDVFTVEGDHSWFRGISNAGDTKYSLIRNWAYMGRLF